MRKIFVVLIAFCVVFGAVKKSNAFILTGGAAAAATLGISSSTALYASIAGHTAVIAVAGYYGHKKYVEYKAANENGTALGRGNAAEGTGIEGEVVDYIDLTQEDIQEVTGGAKPNPNSSEYDIYNDVLYDPSLDKYYEPYMGTRDSNSELGVDVGDWYDGDKAKTKAENAIVTQYDPYDCNKYGCRHYYEYVNWNEYDNPPSENFHELDSTTPEEEWPEYFEPENMVDILDKNGEPEKITGQVTDSPSSEPQDTVNITGSLGDGKFQTASGEVLDVSASDDLSSQMSDISEAEIDQSSLSDIEYKSGNRTGTMDSSVGDALQDQGVDADADIVGQSGNQVYWRDSNGSQHITSVDDDTAQEVDEGTPDGIEEGWSSSGQGQNGTDEGTGELDIASGDIPGAPGEDDVPGFEPGITDEDFGKEKKDFPFSEWKGYIPFYSAVEDSGFQVQNPDPVLSMNLQLASIDKQLTVDFSQWEGILSMMGGIIYVVSSFYALRFALFD